MPPASAAQPMRGSGNPKMAFLLARRMSQANAVSIRPQGQPVDRGDHGLVQADSGGEPGESRLR